MGKLITYGWVAAVGAGRTRAVRFFLKKLCPGQAPLHITPREFHDSFRDPPLSDIICIYVTDICLRHERYDEFLKRFDE